MTHVFPMRPLLILLACLILHATPPAAETPVDLAPCLDIIALLPPDIAALEVLTCRKANISTTLGQLRAEMVFQLPADDVVGIANRLTRDFGMGDLTLVRNVYQPTGTMVGDIPIPNGVLSDGPLGTRPKLSIHIMAAAMPTYIPDAEIPMDFEYAQLGAHPASLILQLTDR